MSISAICNDIFNQSISDYHLHDNVDAELTDPYQEGSLEHLLYHKNWVDTVQWHLEDIIRNPSIDPNAALGLKRRIDASNQVRTDMVEYIDSYFLNQYNEVVPNANASINTESPAWAIDRLSILALKIFHMQAEINRPDASEEHKQNCTSKLAVLVEQRNDLSKAIDDLLADIASGKKYMKVYRQMKMYNDPKLNPILYHHSAK
jgi:hypothetical protein